MFLKSLEIRGFKSFPDKTILNFNSGITAVVGPNGSGKSNISDAIRWVLGEQSSKSLRGTKMEDVIFNGTQDRKSLGFAEVSLTIDNTDRKLDFDNDEVRVTRRYYRSGDSDYMLNNANVRLRDIQLLFMDTGLGRDGYSIIGQGRVADIVASKSADRREIFEEAAGIAKYRFRKNEAERRLANTEANLLRLRDMLVELESRVGPLEHESKKAEKFLEYAGERKGLEIALWLHQIEKARDTLRSLSGKLELARVQYDAAADKIDDIDRQIDAVGEQSALLAAQIDELRRQAQLFEEEATHRDGDIAVRENDILHNNENIARMQGEIEQSRTGGAQIDQEIAACRAVIAEKEAAIAESEKQQLALSEEMDALSRSSDEAGNKLEQANRNAAALALQMADIRVQQSAGETSLSEIELRLSQLTAAVELRQAAAEAAEQELADSLEAVGNCKEQVQSLQNTVGGYQMRADSRNKRLETVRAEVDQLTLDAEDKRRRIKLLEDLENSMEGFSGSVKLVIKQAEAGALRGIRGPITRLIDVPSKVALAIETALGANAQNIVCDREDDAKKAIAYLKNNKAGRATFLPVETIKGRTLDEKGVEDAFGVVGIASDLVTCDERYREILVSLLGRIVVAETLDDATALAKRYHYKFRIVTLDGQVVNAGGSLTGGSHVKGAGLLSRRSEIEKLQADYNKSVAKLEDAKASLNSVQQEASAATAALVGAQGELTTAQEDLIRLEAEQRRLTETAENSRTAVTDCRTEIDTLHTREAEQKQLIAAAVQSAADVAAKQAAIEQELAELSGGRQELAGAREELGNRVSELKLAAVTARKEIEAQEMSIQSLEQRQHDAVGFCESLEQQIAAVQAHNAEIEQNIAKLRQQAADERQRAADVTATAEALILKRTEGEAGVTALRQQQREASDEKERLGGEVARIEEKTTAAQSETDEIIRKLYEEYELTRAEAEAIAPPLENITEATRRLQELKNKIRGLGHVNVGAIDEYKEVKERYDFLYTQVTDVEVSRKELLDLIGDLTGQMRDVFIERFNEINGYFGKIFAELFDGGKAELKLQDPDDVLSSGIDMFVQPPGKVILNLDALSGGEKALTAIALLFAILRVTPSPFCVLDEIEAALDDVNVDRYAQYLRRMTDESQFIVITHRRGTMEEADVLYGVTMQEKGVTTLLELRASEVEARLGLKLNQDNE